MPKRHLAVDLGASNGRTILGIFDGKKFTMEEVNRFPNDPVAIGNAFQWDTLRLYHEIKTGITKAQNEGHLDTVGIDTWGVDYGYVDKNGLMVSPQYHYRDSRTENMENDVFAKIPYAELYSISGIQSQSINTIYQLAADVRYRPYIPENAEAALWTPDLLGFFFTGEKVSEYTIASTGGFLNASERRIERTVLSRLGLKADIFPEVVMPGKVIAPLRSSLDDEFGNSGTNLVSVPSHDTASAIMAIPSANPDTLFISSGTWSIMGVLSDTPVLTERARELGFSNEGGAFGEITLIKNIMGLWIEQECRRQWKREGKTYTFDELSFAAREAKPLRSIINPADPIFTPAGNMPKRICEYCEKTNQPVPETVGEIIRTVFESLALCYRKIADDLESLTGKKYSTINIIGGGTKEPLLNELTASACNRTVIAGPSEATSLGNIAMQSYACGEFSNREQIRDAIIASCEIQTIESENDTSAWDKAYEKFLTL